MCFLMKGLMKRILVLLVSLCWTRLLRSEVVDTLDELKYALSLCKVDANDTCSVSISKNIFVNSTVYISGTVEINGIISDGNGTYPSLLTPGSNSIFGVSSAKGNLTLQYLHLISNRSDIYSAGEFLGQSLITLDVNATLIVANCQFTNGNADSGGAIRSFEQNYVRVEDSAFTGNTAFSKYGGAVRLNSNSQGEIRNCIFQRNKAYARGGSVYASGSTLLVSNSSFYGDGAGNGGSIACEYSSICKATNAYFYDTFATYAGGALEVSGVSGMLVTESHFFRTDAMYGGSIHVEYGSNISVNNGNFFESSSVYAAGVINLSGATSAVLINCTIISSMSENGGVFKTEYGSIIKFVNSTILDSLAKVQGGFGFVIDSAAFLEGNIFINCSSHISGGVIFSSSSTLNMTGNFAVGNKALLGGFMYADSSTVAIMNGAVSADATTDLESCHQRFPVMCCSLAKSSYGGNIFNCHEAVDGSVFNVKDSDFSSVGSLWQHNSAIVSATIKLGSTYARFSDNYFGKNSAGFAGAIYVVDLSNPYNFMYLVEITNCTFQSNTVYASHGTVINIVAGYMKVSNSSFSDNINIFGSGTVLIAAAPRFNTQMHPPPNTDIFTWLYPIDITQFVGFVKIEYQ